VLPRAAFDHALEARRLERRMAKHRSVAPMCRLGPAVQSHFRVEVNREGSAIVLAIGGELDLSSSAALEDEITKAVQTDAACVVIDLRELEFVDSTGLGVLVKANQLATDAGRKFGLVRGGPQVERLLDLTGLADRLKIADTPEELIGGS
jgi:anti-anti-sigma factor